MATITQKDTTFTKIFVGGLPYHTTDQSLREFFEQFGEIEEAVVITDRQTGKSRGYGFVTMADRTSAERACKEMNPVIDGRKANVNLAYLGAKPRGSTPIATTTALPFALKAGYPGFIQSPLAGYPQYVLPSATYMTAAAAANPATAGSVGNAVPQQSPMSPSSAAVAAAAAGQYFDYAGGLQAAQYANAAAYDAAAAGYPYTQAAAAAAAGFMTPSAAAAYQYAANASVPQQLTFAHAAYQPQQIPAERMQ